jgi:hypothetical protein
MKVTSSAYERYELVGSAAELVKNAIDFRWPAHIKYRVNSLKGRNFL